MTPEEFAKRKQACQKLKYLIMEQCISIPPPIGMIDEIGEFNQEMYRYLRDRHKNEGDRA